MCQQDGPALSKRMHEAFTAASGKVEYRLLPPFGNAGHFLISRRHSDLVGARDEISRTNRNSENRFLKA
jgi:hypothetical protein